MLTGCQNNTQNIKTSVQGIENTIPDTEGDNISFDELEQISYVINNMDLSSSNVNSLPFYITLTNGSVGIVTYYNNANYAVNITIKGASDTSVYKKITVPAKSTKEIKFSPSRNLSNDITSIYTIDIHCSEVNFDGSLTLQTALRKNNT